MSLGGTNAAVTLLATFLLLLSTATTAIPPGKPPVSRFCTSARPYRALCTRMVKGATTWSAAMTYVILAAADSAKGGAAVIDGVKPNLPAALPPVSKDSIDSTCREAFDKIVFDLESCVGLVISDPTSALKSYLSSISFNDCKFALEEFQITLPEVDRFDEQLTKLAGILLSVLEKKPESGF